MESFNFAIKRHGYKSLRPTQKDILENLTSKNDCLFCAPTGSGKSVIFELSPFLFHHLDKGT